MAEDTVRRTGTARNTASSRTRATPAGRVSGRFTPEQERKLAEHRGIWGAKHERLMREGMSRGMSFQRAHRFALQSGE